jgi:hypothetical protein
VDLPIVRRECRRELGAVLGSSANELPVTFFPGDQVFLVLQEMSSESLIGRVWPKFSAFVVDNDGSYFPA